ncbi:M16 family metallopeptidase [Planctomycetota bacterium]
MSVKIDKCILNNGMVILGEPMEGVGSAAFGFMLPAGASRLPKGCCGAGAVISDWIFRGAGARDSRELGDALDGLGLHRASGVGSSYMTIGAALEAGNLSEALELYADIILNHRLETDQFVPAKQLAIDAVYGLDDNPAKKVMLKLRELFYPNPLGTSAVGNIEDLESLKAEKTKAIIKDNFNLSGTIFAVAGKYDFDAVCRQIEKRFSTAEQRELAAVKIGAKGDRYTHIHNDGAQVHIGLMTETVCPGDDDYYNARVAVSVLSGGMSARLFTEVREKRGLCYAIGARYHGLKAAAGIACYAGTTPEKAQETYDVIKEQFNILSDGISAEEIEKAKVGLKSSLIMSSESSASRADGIGSDYYILGRVRSLDEIKDAIEATSVESVLGFLRNNKFEEYTVVTVGPGEIQF